MDNAYHILPAEADESERSSEIIIADTINSDKQVTCFVFGLGIYIVEVGKQ